MSDHEAFQRNLEIGNQLYADRQFREAIMFYEKAMAIQRNPSVLVNCASALKESGEFGHACRLMDEADSLVPDDDPETKGLIAYNLGNTYRDFGKIAESISHYQRAIALRPGHKGQHFNLGQAFFQMDEFDLAVEQYDFVIDRIDSEDVGALRQKQLALEAKTSGMSIKSRDRSNYKPHYKWKNSEARQVWDELIHTMIKSTEVVGEQLIHLHEQALEDVNMILRLEPENLSSSFWAIAGRVCGRLGVLRKDTILTESSIEFSEKALSLHEAERPLQKGELSPLYEALTMALIEVDRYKEGAKYCELGLKLAPESEYLHDCRAFLTKLSTTGQSTETSSNKHSGCFIATAVCGSPNAKEVLELRQFRENCLVNSASGRNLVQAYYAISPPIANYLRQHAFSSRLIYNLAIKPLAFFSKLFCNSAKRRRNNDKN